MVRELAFAAAERRFMARFSLIWGEGWAFWGL